MKYLAMAIVFLSACSGGAFNETDDFRTSDAMATMGRSDSAALDAGQADAAPSDAITLDGDAIVHGDALGESGAADGAADAPVGSGFFCSDSPETGGGECPLCPGTVPCCENGGKCGCYHGDPACWPH